MPHNTNEELRSLYYILRDLPIYTATTTTANVSAEPSLPRNERYNYFIWSDEEIERYLGLKPIWRKERKTKLGNSLD